MASSGLLFLFYFSLFMIQVVSDLTGPIVVEDVIYENINDDDAKKDLKYRRLIFQRAESLVQSEALLSTKASIETEKNKNKKACMFVLLHSIQ